MSNDYFQGREFVFRSWLNVWDFSLPHVYIITAYYGVISRNRTLGCIACLLGIKAYLEATQNYHLYWKGTTALMCFAYLYGAIKLGELGSIMLTHREVEYDQQDIKVKNPVSVPARIYWCLEAAPNLRCIGFKCGKRRYTINKPSRRAILIPALLRLGAVDIVTTLTHHLASLNGQLPCLQRPLWQQLALTFLVALSLYNTFQGSYGILQYVGIYWFDNSPDVWPPMLLRPWAATSLAQFWSKEWHSVFRRIFLFYTSLVIIPISEKYRLGKDDKAALTTMTVFLMSALLHVTGLFLLSGHVYYRTFLFFVLQGPAVLMERRLALDKSVVFGRIWTYSFLLMTAGPIGMIGDVVDLGLPDSILTDEFFRDVSIASRIINYFFDTSI